MMTDNNSIAMGYDKAALDAYYRGEYKHAYNYGTLAVKLCPDDDRLKDNLRWYSQKYQPSENNENNYTYLTLLSDNSYINGLVVLWRSLQATECKYPLTVMITEEVSQENRNVLNQLGVDIIELDMLIPPGLKYEDAPSIIETLDTYGWHKALVKLRMFGLTQFTKFVFIDADIVVKQNIDSMFELPHMSAVNDCTNFDGGFGDTPHTFNSGLLVVEPDKTLESNIIEFLNNFDSGGKLIHDQWIMQEYYKNWPEYVGLHLPVWYAPWSAYFSDTTDEFYYQMHKVKTIHMIDRKPWFCGSQGYKDLSGEYPVYAELCLHYIGMINFTIKELENRGITSSDLKIIT